MHIDESRSPYESCLALCFILILGYYFFQIDYLLLAAIIFALVALLNHKAASLIHRVWIVSLEYFGKFMNLILMGGVFYIFLTPLAFLYRTLVKDPLHRKKLSSKSNYHDRSHTYSKEDLKNPW